MEIQIINRLPMGVAFGFTYFEPDETHNFEDLTIHLVIIDLRFIW